MNVLEVKGPIVSNDDYWIYEWLDYEATCPKVINQQLKEFKGQDITVEINSPGGSVFAGSEIYTALKSYLGNVAIKIVGMAASAASVIAMAGNKVSMSPTAQIMIHNASVVAQGDHRDMEHTADFLKGINESISNAYKIKSGLSTEELLEMMDNETWITSKIALELGLIDEIMFENENLQVVANVDGMLPTHVINKLKNTIKKPNNKDLERKQKELENKLKEIDLTLMLKE
ncbi:head maturation protease, ClpP-related [Tissierella creatinophila]|uniref:ATP-dependent Clp protease proteolytic subunit n=1 Tax=Tissierella creatinophila DSM 6911 TaxID=1123403 RepID=A0A1U7M6S1_TISCR|nr:head maturation protease, ClpP-related [Tissierella creatinophila]OLS02888.1 ATP-dependent Clp protease proteolytic subunit [Tissierella creatinophila DSM 6911]